MERVKEWEQRSGLVFPLVDQFLVGVRLGGTCHGQIMPNGEDDAREEVGSGEGIYDSVRSALLELRK